MERMMKRREGNFEARNKFMHKPDFKLTDVLETLITKGFFIKENK